MKLLPYKPQVILDVSWELWKRSLGLVPKLLTDDAGVLLYKVLERGLDTEMPTPADFSKQVPLDGMVAMWATQVVIHKVDGGRYPRVPNVIYTNLFDFAYIDFSMDLSIRERHQTEPMLWEHYKWLCGLKPDRYAESSDRLLLLIHNHNL